jgi:uncharacterized protein
MKLLRTARSSLFISLLFFLLPGFVFGQRLKPVPKPAPTPIVEKAPKTALILKPTQPKLSKADSIRLAMLRIEKQKIATAKTFFKAEKYAKAFPLLKRYSRSEVFDAEARLFLGECYLKPLGPKLPDAKNAVLYLNMATLNPKTRVESLMTLGQLYLNGTNGFLPNVPQALPYLKQAADAQNLQAIYLIGQLTFYGTAGTPQDEPTGILYLEKAANAGLIDAQWALATIYTQGTPTFPKNLKQAKIWYQKVALARQTKLANSL